eukprot:2620379-Alexandrium_andersonii.AAC.1
MASFSHKRGQKVWIYGRLRTRGSKILCVDSGYGEREGESSLQKEVRRSRTCDVGRLRPSLVRGR